MTYFQHLVKQGGVDATASNAGTEPDETVAPKVAAYLGEEGFDLSGFTPPLLSDEALAQADYVVSIGCISVDAVPSSIRFLDWSDVPQPSVDLQGSRDAIYERVYALVNELSG